MSYNFSGLHHLGGNKVILSIASLVFLFLVYTIVAAGYSILLGPVARIPGPRLRAVSYIPFAYASARGRAPFDVRALHQRYGPVVRVHPTLVSFNLANAWKDIYGHKAPTAHQKQSYQRLRPGVQDILTADAEVHARQRQALSPAFSEKALRGQEPLITSHVDQLVTQLERHIKHTENEVLDMRKWMEYVTFDIIGELALNTHFDCLQNSNYSPWVTILTRFFKSVAYVVNAKLLGPVMFPLLMLFAPIKDLKGGKDHIRLSMESVQSRLKATDTSNHPDLWTYILQHNEKASEASHMTVPEMEINAAILLPAGSETMASALSGALYLLAKHPTVKKKLYSELSAHLASESKIDISSITTLPYLQAVLDETLRLYPPFPASLQRKVPKGGAVIAGQEVSEDIFVTVFQLSLYTSASNFNRPLEFVPERFLPAPERPSWAKNDEREAFAPFSIGPRNCIGKTLAYAEMKLILTRLMLHFDFELLNDGFELENQRVFIIRDKPALDMKLKLRRH